VSWRSDDWLSAVGDEWSQTQSERMPAQSYKEDELVGTEEAGTHLRRQHREMTARAHQAV